VGGQLVRDRVDREVHVELRAAHRLDEVGEVGQHGLGVQGGHVGAAADGGDRRAGLLERACSEGLDLAEGLAGALGAAGEAAQAGPGLEGDRDQGVPDHVVHLARDPHPLLDDRRARLRLSERFEFAVSLCKERVLVPADSEEVTDEQRERDRQEVADHVGRARRAGSRNEPGDQRDAGRDPDQEGVAA
jgi:hypothetical protein